MSAASPPPADVARTATRLEDLSGRGFDVVVIGGGINGAGIAREAALSGYSVALFEKHDFAWGTTWRSTKLIHGGLRYLEHGEVGLVFESLRDRALLMREYPGIVRPLRLLLPVYAGDRHGPGAIGLGLTAYDGLSFRPGRPGLPRHRRLGAEQARAAVPELRTQGLRAAFEYWDCQVAYPERLCLETLAEARSAGAATLNHAAVVAPLSSPGRIHGVVVRDELSGQTAEVRARLVINAAGPWADQVMRSLNAPLDRLGGTRGAHIVVDLGRTGPPCAVYAQARSDHRPFFVIPWRGKHLIGTTDSRFEGAPDTVVPMPAEVDYLLREARSLLPGSWVSADAVLYAYAGVRPLPRSPSEPEGAITRRHLITDHAADGAARLVSILGGKLSTYRSLSRQTVSLIRQRLGSAGTGRAARPAIRRPTTVEGASPELLGRSAPLGDYLRRMYGPSLPGVLQLIGSDESLLRPLCEHGPDIEAQVVYAARYEQAATLADVLLRRCGSGWNECLGLDCAPRAAGLMAAERAWPASRSAEEIAAFRRELEAIFLSRALGSRLGANP